MKMMNYHHYKNFIQQHEFIKYSQLVSNTGPNREMRFDKAPLLKICE